MNYMAGVGLANGQFKAVYPEAVGCDTFGQYITDQPPACLDKGCQYQPSEPLKAHSPWNLSKSNDYDILVLKMIWK